MNRYGRIRWGFAIVLFGMAAATVACGGGGGGGSAAPGQQPAALTSGTALLTIPNRVTASSVRQAQYVSASVVSVGIAINGAGPTFANVSASSTLCTATSSGRTCAIPVGAPAGAATFVITLYDGPSGSGNLLGTGSVTQTVVLGTAFSVNVVVNGVIATLAIAVSPTSLPAVPGTPSTATITATAKDADGNTIIGPGNYTTPIALTNSDTSGATSISPTSLTTIGQTATLTYNGSSSLTQVITLGAQVPGIPATAVTTTAVTLVTPGPSTPKPSATPSPTPAPSSSATSVANGCGTSLTIPGTYTTIISVGTYSGTTYTANTSSGSSVWISNLYTAASPSPAPSFTAASPNPSPTATRTPQPVYDFIGTYQLASGTSGCFTVITSQDGSPLSFYNGSSLQGVSGIADGGPNVTGNYTIGTGTSGTLGSLVINNLGAGGGSGTVALSNGDSGTITLTSRFSSSLDEARKLIEQVRRQ